jgi:glycosyltransferase involved in cell wall biosynthesis
MKTSVVIASYNYGHLIGEAIGSVQAQTVDDLEIIVVDDGSTDDTPAALERIDEPRLRVLRIPNGGVAAARNAGLEMARGEFIAFLDADDRWLPTKLERQLALFESEPEVGLVFTDFSRFDDAHVYRATHFDQMEELRRVPSRPSRAGGGRVVTGDTFSVLVPIPQLPAWPSATMVRARDAGDVRFPPGVRLCEDLHYMLRVYPRVRAAYIAEPLTELRRHGRNSYVSLLEIGGAAAAVLQAAAGEPRDPAHREVLRRRLGRQLIGLAYANFHAQRPWEAAKAALRALAYRGSRVDALRRLALLPLLPWIADEANIDWTEKPEPGAV